MAEARVVDVKYKCGCETGFHVAGGGAFANPCAQHTEPDRLAELDGKIAAAYEEWEAVGGRDTGGRTTAEHIGVRVMELSDSLYSWEPQR